MGWRSAIVSSIPTTTTFGLVLVFWGLIGANVPMFINYFVEHSLFQAGTLLAIGITSSGVQDPVDPACAILMDHIQSERIPMRIGSILGLGLAYANSKRETVVKDEEGGVVYELKKVFFVTKLMAINS